jgi:trehalose-phosphatase
MVRIAPHRLLILDYDGTLAAYQIERDRARPSERTRMLLCAIASNGTTRLAISSGRPLVEVEPTLGELDAVLIGETGWEYRIPGHEIVRHPLGPGQVDRLFRAEAIAVESGWGGLLERKRSAIVLHTRGMDPVEARDLERRALDAWREVSNDGELLVEKINGGVEVRAQGHDLASMARWLLSIGEDSALVAYVGDDTADERGFRAVEDFGFGVRVGPDSVPTCALGRLSSCDAIDIFLEEWLRATA